MIQNIVIGIDATNIRAGGGVTHLVELLNAFKELEVSNVNIVLFANNSVLQLIHDSPNLTKVSHYFINKGLFFRTVWQKFYLDKQLETRGCRLLFVPGGSYGGSFHTVISLSQNLLPFEIHELFRFGISLLTFKLLMLRFTQSITFKKSNGVIFLTKYAKSTVENVVGKLDNTTVIPHGINERFFSEPKVQKPIEYYSKDNPFNIIYVSTVDHYKHQWNVIEAVMDLYESGYPIKLTLIGSARPSALRKMNSILRKYKSSDLAIHYLGAISFNDLHDYYSKSDLGLFASSCENLPNIILEKMASGLPIVSSNKGPMPSVLGNEFPEVFFNPENIQDIKRAVKVVIKSQVLRENQSRMNYEKSKKYTWLSCSKSTIDYLKKFTIN